MNKKQVMDIRPNSDGISQAESNEQQRNWSEDFLRKKSNDPMANYDPTRTHLNFEVARSGIVQPIEVHHADDGRQSCSTWNKRP